MDACSCPASSSRWRGWGGARVELVDDGILIRPADDDRTELPIADTVVVDSTSQSLYSADPPSKATNGTGKRGWRFGKAKHDAK